MSANIRGVLVALIGSLAVAACASDGALLDRASLKDAVTLPADSVPLPLPRPAPKSSALQSTAAPQDVWRHLSEPVSVQQFNQDKAKCTRMANSAPGAGSPEIKFYLVFSNCMRSVGYEPGSSAVPRPISNENGNETDKGEHGAPIPSRGGYAHATT
jgi:hypothetical protein